MNVFKKLNLSSRKRLFFLLFSICYSLVSQTSVLYNSARNFENFTLDISEDNSHYINFYYPSLRENPVTYSGLQFKDEKNYITVEHIGFFDQETFSATVYTENVEQVIFKTSVLGNCNDVILDFDADGYHLPLNLDFKCDLKKQTINLNFKINFTVIPRKEDEKFKLVLADLSLGSKRLTRQLSPLPQFQNSNFQNSRFAKSLKYNDFDSYGVYKNYPVNQFEEYFKSSLIVFDTDKEQMLIIDKILNNLLENYPFYKERQLNRASIMKKFERILEQSKDVCDLVIDLKTALEQTFNDPHFNLDYNNCGENSKRKTSPIYAYSFGKYAEIAAIFDEDLSNEIALGWKLLRIGTTNISSKFLRKNDINNILKNFEGETVYLKIKDSKNKIHHVSYVVKSNYNIPTNFRPQNLLFEKLNSDVSYYKVNKINGEMIIDFLNKTKEINQRKKLVLDLRGNGGGDFIQGAQFLSYFMKNEFKYFDLFDRNTSEETSVIINNFPSSPKIGKDIEITLLIDKNTSCVAELIAYNMSRYRENTCLIGKENTKGALAYVYEVALPSKIKFKTDAIGAVKILLDNQSIEGVGIHPDLLVDIQSVYDLQPYRDKVLKEAIAQ